MDKLLVIDGNSMLHRAYYALPDWRNRSGEATAGVYGFLSMLLRAIEELKPTHLAIVFDTPEPNFRHSLYVGYQAKREKEKQVTEDIWGQVEKLKIVFEKLKVPVYTAPGFEADDVIGTICEKISNFEIVVITGDKDLMQLVNEKVKLYMPVKGLSDGQIVDEVKVIERMGVHPNQVVDYKGLAGDGSDGYPGVPGIGPKTAIHLLAEYGTLDNIYTTLLPPPNLGGGVGEKLAKGREAAKLSQKLATIRLDVPLTFDERMMMLPDEHMIVDVLRELGYKSLIKRMGGIEDPTSPEASLGAQAKLFE